MTKDMCKYQPYIKNHRSSRYNTRRHTLFQKNLVSACPCSITSNPKIHGLQMEHFIITFSKQMALGFDKKVFLSHIYWRIRIKLNEEREGGQASNTSHISPGIWSILIHSMAWKEPPKIHQAKHHFSFVIMLPSICPTLCQWIFIQDLCSKLHKLLWSICLSVYDFGKWGQIVAWHEKTDG